MLRSLSVGNARQVARNATKGITSSSTSAAWGIRRFSQKSKPPFDKILIANRGEIACRIIKTARKMGVKTVAVYSDADASNMHVKMADEAYWIGHAASSESYLCMDKILDVAKYTGAQGIHPGYGFLSENADFVDMVEAAGIAFIGPSSAPMHAMGDKISSKKIAKDAGCFTIPGFEGEVKDADHAVALAQEVGYPVMLKASAGGGGKGMRVAYNDEETREGFLLSQAEARSSFGDDRMLIERFVEDPHHIEIQVLADAHGNVVAFPERECSVQRRNQKVVEESPSCLLTPETRRAMQEQAIALCHATGYRSAGTIEMLADGQQNFYFLEMNTRLQVEHPVSELVTGEDLVEHMLNVAAGHKLPDHLIANPFLQAQGSAFESRVYAEDPLRGFLPSIGPLITYREPAVNHALSAADGSNYNYTGSNRVVRIDTGVFEGANISMHYDPMISKLCTHAPTRAESIDVMERALDQYVVQGLGNNITFLRSVFRNEKFRSGNYSTKFIGDEYPDGFHGVQLTGTEIAEFLALGAALHSAATGSPLFRSMSGAAGAAAGAGSSVPTGVSREQYLASNRYNLLHRQTVHLAGGLGNIDEEDVEDEMTNGDYFFPDGGEEEEEARDSMVVVLGGDAANATATTVYRVDMLLHHTLSVSVTPLDSDSQEPNLSLTKKVDLSSLEWQPGQPLAFASIAPAAAAGAMQEDGEEEQEQEVAVQYLGRNAYTGVYTLRYLGCERDLTVRTAEEHRLSSAYMLPPVVKDVSACLLCPMPGTLISCSVEAGQQVQAGEQLAVVEAMKMQNVLRAERAGVVKSVLHQEGAHLKVDEVILEFEKEGET